MKYDNTQDNIATIIATLFVALGLALGFANGYNKDLELVRKEKAILEVKKDAEIDYFKLENARKEGYINGLQNGRGNN